MELHNFTNQLIKGVGTKMAKKFVIITIFCCYAFSGQKKVQLQSKGSDTMVNLVQMWAEEFTKKYPEISIAVTGGGTGTGIVAYINGTCDIVAASRKMTPQEVALAKNKAREPKEYIVALDGIVVVVHPSNPVEKLTLAQLRDIFTGKISTWQELGIKPGQFASKVNKIVVLSREINSGTHIFFKEHVLRLGDPQSREEFYPACLLLPSSQAIADEVAQNPSAIGYYGVGYISSRQKVISVGKDSTTFISPNEETIRSGKYPISRPLFLYTKKMPSPEVTKFIEFVLSEAGQRIVKKAHFIPIKKVSS